MESKPRILVVDDDLMALELLRIAFRENYEVITAPSGEKALELIYDFVPDLIILDIMMPGMNGYEICAELKSRRRFSSIPVIMLTARAAHDDLVHGFRTGANVYVTKPFKLSELTAEIDEQLDRARKLHSKEWVRGWVEFTIRNDVKYLGELNHLIEQLHVQSNLADNTIIDFGLAFRELLDNAYEHGNRKNPDKSIFVSYMLLEDRLVIKIEDMGAGFDAEQIPDPTTEENLFKLRGRGIFIARELMDEVHFSKPRQELDPEALQFIPPEERNRLGQIVLMVKHLQ